MLKEESKITDSYDKAEETWRNKSCEGDYQGTRYAVKSSEVQYRLKKKEGKRKAKSLNFVRQYSL